MDVAPYAHSARFTEFSIVEFFHQGGFPSTCSYTLQRPKPILTPRFVCHKIPGWGYLLISKFFDQIDDFPRAYRIIFENNSMSIPFEFLKVEALRGW